MTATHATDLVLIRHGPTRWNAEKRLQGQTDEPLSPEGRDAVAGWRLPPELAARRWLVSPLTRARETAALLGIEGPELEPRLMEMSWGEWEGRTLPDLRAELGGAMIDIENRGLDLRPPGGESPRLLQERLKPLLAEIAARGAPAGAVCHRGVIRAILALATGWNMLGKPPHKVKNACWHRFSLTPDGTPVVEAMNLSLIPGEQQGEEKQGEAGA